MAFESVKNYLFSIFQYFGISLNSEDDPSTTIFVRESLDAARYATIGPEGSSVDPEPLPNSDIAAPTAAASWKIRAYSSDVAIEKPQLLKAPLCNHSVSLDFAETAATSGGNGGSGTSEKKSEETLARKTGQEPPVLFSEPAKSVKESVSDGTKFNSEDVCPTLEVGSERADERKGGLERTSAAYLERLIQLKREAEKHLPPAPSTFRDDTAPRGELSDEVCALYRICPQLAPGAAAVAAPKQARLKSRTMFNAPLYSEGDFELRIVHDKVCLEFVLIDETEIHGFVRVLNAAYVKHVTVDHTEDDWESVRTTSAEWVETVSEGRLDRFQFVIPGRRSAGNLRFSLSFEDAQDDNKGRTYTVCYEHY